MEKTIEVNIDLFEFYFKQHLEIWKDFEEPILRDFIIKTAVKCLKKSNDYED